jgi:hypothetical protein
VKKGEKLIGLSVPELMADLKQKEVMVELSKKQAVQADAARLVAKRVCFTCFAGELLS